MNDHITDEELMLAEAEDLDNIYKSEWEAEQASLHELRTPAKALEFLIEAHGGDTCDGDVPLPVEVLQVIDCRIGSRTTSMEASVVCSDGTTRSVKAYLEYWSGSFDEPPYGDAGYEYMATFT